MMSWEGGQGHQLAQDDQGVTISHPLDTKQCLTEGQQLSPNRQPPTAKTTTTLERAFPRGLGSHAYL